MSKIGRAMFVVLLALGLLGVCLRWALEFYENDQGLIFLYQLSFIGIVALTLGSLFLAAIGVILKILTAPGVSEIENEEKNRHGDG